MQTVSIQPATRPSSLLAQLVAPLLTAAVVGAVILYGVGFSPIEVAHNAAHDGRHSHAFPCH